ncbi:MAG: DUF3747 domain-containing protein [Hormoscilla sp.]
MKSIQTLATIVATAMTSFASINPAIASIFGQQAVNQNDFVAVAVPVDGGNSQRLVILEQKSNRRACWNEYGSDPVRIEPLLLSFDFTGICGRAADSNAYSIRVGGRDLGLKYTLFLQVNNGKIFMIGKDLLNPNAPVLTIGKTNGITNEYMKIDLEPGWYFTKRTYNGRTLGHIYLTRD